MLAENNTALLVVDVQERLTPVLYQSEIFVAACRRMISGAKILELPILLTEQYPKGLGHTIYDVRLLCKNEPLFEKTRFSAYVDEVASALKQLNIKNVVLIGCETHICVFQTALDLLANGYKVYLPQESLTSRTAENKHNGLALMQQAGAVVTNIETILFQLLQDANHSKFKEISKLIR